MTISCRICCEGYSNSVAERIPKVIPCGHAMCFGCLKHLFKNWSQPTCPFCKEDIPGPLKKIKTNFGLLDVITSPSKIETSTTKNEGPPSKRMKMEYPIDVGDIVKRGPDWKWGNDDGGRGGLGIVMDTTKYKGWVTVMWDTSGKQSQYRWGRDNCFDLELCSKSLAGVMVTRMRELQQFQHLLDGDSSKRPSKQELNDLLNRANRDVLKMRQKEACPT